MKTFLYSVLFGLAVTALPPAVQAQTPAGTGTVFNPSNGVPMGKYEAFADPSVPTGFRYRVWESAGNYVCTVVPFQTAPGEVRMWFIRYQYAPANPTDTRFWSDVGAGRVVLFSSMSTPTSTAGTYTMTRDSNGPIANPRAQPYGFRVP